MVPITNTLEVEQIQHREETSVKMRRGGGHLI